MNFFERRCKSTKDKFDEKKCRLKIAEIDAKLNEEKEIEKRKDVAEGFASVMDEYYNKGETYFKVDLTNYGCGRYAAVQMLQKCDPDWVRKIREEKYEI